MITSFPQRWNRKQSNNDLDVVESIRKHINLLEGRDPLRSAYDLAVLIASFCSEVFFEREDDPEPLDEKLQFLEFFDKSIGDVVSCYAICLSFQTLIFLRLLMRLHASTVLRVFSKTSTTRPGKMKGISSKR